MESDCHPVFAADCAATAWRPTSYASRALIRPRHGVPPRRAPGAATRRELHVLQPG